MKVTWADLEVGATLATLSYRRGIGPGSPPTETEAAWRDRLFHRISFELTRVDCVETHQNSGVDAFTCRHVTLGPHNEPITTRWVVIRGTDNPWDWYRDMRIRKVDGPFGKTGEFVHLTWLDDAARLWSHMKVAAICRYADRHGERVAIVGHSLGGATGVLMAALARQDDIPIHLLMPISCPRVGSDVFADALQRKLGMSRIFRFTRCRDAVCRVPLRRCGWAHVGANHYFDRFGEYHRDPTRGYMAWDRTAQKLAELTDMRVCNSSAWQHHQVGMMANLITTHARRIAQ